MKETGILNREIAYAISKMGHKDLIMIADAGFAIPKGIECIDLSIKKNFPTVCQVLNELLKHFSVEKIFFADETNKMNPKMHDKICNMFRDDVEIQSIKNNTFRKKACEVKTIIRTGDFTAYTNVILVSAGGNRWYIEN